MAATSVDLSVFDAEESSPTEQGGWEVPFASDATFLPMLLAQCPKRGVNGPNPTKHGQIATIFTSESHRMVSSILPC